METEPTSVCENMPSSGYPAYITICIEHLSLNPLIYVMETKLDLFRKGQDAFQISWNQIYPYAFPLLL